MISDEMRELLSAYVDGELRDADAARVEDVSKRDPELRRQIEAYRTLRRKLREWDAADHGIAPSSSFLGSTLARARTMDAALAAPPQVRFLGPLAMAATLLLAVGAGYLIARSTAPEAPPLPGTGTHVAVKPLGPAPDLALPDSALAPAPVPGTALVRMRIDDHIPSLRALELEDVMRREEIVRVTQPERVRRTTPPISEEILAMMEGYAARPASRDSLVVLARPGALTGLPSAEPAASGSRPAMDSAGDRRLLERNLRDAHVLAPLGEVWTAKDGRTRLVAEADWLSPRQDMFLRVAWSDGVEVPKGTETYEVQETILGPKARRRLLSAKTGPDPDFVAWLRDAYGTGPLRELLAADGKDRDRAMNKLLDALRGDKTATGFAVLDARGNLLGVEIFHDHALMLGFAPRLLRGYILETGEDGIRVTPPMGVGRADKVQGFLDGLPGAGVRVDRQKLDGKDGYVRAPKDLCRANLVGPSGRILGHGLLIDDAPIHLTLFGE